MAWTHPVLWQRIGGRKNLVVVDPRRTETARAASLHLAIAPGTDVALFNGMLHVILWEGWADEAYIRAHTEGFDAAEFAAILRSCAYPHPEWFEVETAETAAEEYEQMARDQATGG